MWGHPQEGADTCSLTLPTMLPSAGMTVAPIGKMLRAAGPAGLCPLHLICPCFGSSACSFPGCASLPCTSNTAALPYYLLGRRRATGRLSTLSLATRCITLSAKDHPPSLLTASAALTQGLSAGLGSTISWGRRAGHQRGCTSQHIPGRQEAVTVLLFHAGSCSPSVWPCLASLCKRV